jgi:hypothetical protein
MKSLIGGLLLASVLLLGASKEAKDQGWKPTPLMRSATPDTAKIGVEVTIVGEYLDKARVSEVFLTDGKTETKTTIVAQSETSIKIKIPDSVKPGRMRLMVLTTGLEPQFLEQPVSISIE